MSQYVHSKRQEEPIREDGPSNQPDDELQVTRRRRKRTPGEARATNTMDPDERRVDLENDDWTYKVREHSVVCKGCKKTIKLDRRSLFYRGLWDKHRSRCSEIRKLGRAGVNPRDIRMDDFEEDATFVAVNYSPENAKGSTSSSIVDAEEMGGSPEGIGEAPSDTNSSKYADIPSSMVSSPTPSSGVYENLSGEEHGQDRENIDLRRSDRWGHGASGGEALSEQPQTGEVIQRDPVGDALPGEGDDTCQLISPSGNIVVVSKSFLEDEVWTTSPFDQGQGNLGVDQGSKYRCSTLGEMRYGYRMSE